jgi:hypothetical protein
MTSIVDVQVRQTIAPTPATLQQTGAMVSQGATTIGVGNISLLTQLSDLTAILTGAKPLASLAWSTGVVTVTAAAAHGFTSGDSFALTIVGVTPAGYNGTYTCTVTGPNTFTFPLAANPGLETIPGSYSPEDVAELVAMATTYFAQGFGTAVYVLELGAGNAADGVTALNTYVTANPNSNYTPGATGYFYAYLVPRGWANDSTYRAFLAQFENTTARTYFFTTMSIANYGTFSNLMKCAIGLIEAPGIPVTEFTIAAMFYVALNYKPSITNKVGPYAFQFVFGVTPYPTINNGPLLETLKEKFVNVIGTGAEGGITNTIQLWGTTMDGRDFTYWYSVDWVEINIDLDISNEIINGSNNPQNPLYYNQQGINRLKARAQGTMNRGVAYGLVLSPVAVTAVDFAPYVKINESDYKIGAYNGLAVVYTPARGFISILFNVNVTDFPLGV